MWRAAALAVDRCVSRAGDDRTTEVRERHLEQRRPLYVAQRDGVERDVDAARALCDGVGVPVHGLLVESIDTRYLGCSSRRGDLFGNGLERSKSATGEGRPSRSRANARATAPPDCASGAVDDGVLVLEHHLDPPFVLLQVGRYAVRSPIPSATTPTVRDTTPA
jgi:hypothetical protein